MNQVSAWNNQKDLMCRKTNQIIKKHAFINIGQFMIKFKSFCLVSLHTSLMRN